MSDMSDTSREDHVAPIAPTGRINARHLSRHTGSVLREVAFDERCFAIEHFGRVVGFLVPLEGRSPQRRDGRIVYEATRPEPLRDLDAIQADVIETIHRLGAAVMDQLVKDRASIRPVSTALYELESGPAPLVVRPNGRYRLTPEGVRHAEALGL